MTPTHSRKGSRRYGYYACLRALKQGRRTCPSGWVPAAEIEQVVVERLREAAAKEPGGADTPGAGGDVDSWSALAPREQARIIHESIQRVDYDGKNGRLRITLRHEIKARSSANENHKELCNASCGHD
jgi:hypothetical protein